MEGEGLPEDKLRCRRKDGAGRLHGRIVGEGRGREAPEEACEEGRGERQGEEGPC